MWVADMDFEADSHIINELDKKIKHRVFGYPISLGAKQAVVDW